MDSREAGERRSARSAIDRVSAALALFGGVLMLALAGLVTASVLSRWATSQSIAGDFDLVQMGVALAIFAFLPFCQLRGANIFVDTFTLRLPARARALLDALWSAVYAGVAGLLAWRMAVGARETVASGTSSMVLGLPVGWAMLLAAAFTTWLALVALVVAVRAVRTEAQ